MTLRDEVIRLKELAHAADAAAAWEKMAHYRVVAEHAGKTLVCTAELVLDLEARIASLEFALKTAIQFAVDQPADKAEVKSE